MLPFSRLPVYLHARQLWLPLCTTTSGKTRSQGCCLQEALQGGSELSDSYRPHLCSGGSSCVVDPRSGLLLLRRSRVCEQAWLGRGRRQQRGNGAQRGEHGACAALQEGGSAHSLPTLAPGLAPHALWTLPFSVWAALKQSDCSGHHMAVLKQQERPLLTPHH